MKLTASLLLTLAFLTSCDAGPAYAEGWWDAPAKSGIIVRIAAKATPVVKAPAAPAAKTCTTHLAQVDAMAADAVERDPSLIYRKFSPADSAKLIAYINAQPPVARTFNADFFTALVPGDKEAPVLIGGFKDGCLVFASKVSHASYDTALKIVLGLGQDS